MHNPFSLVKMVSMAFEFADRPALNFVSTVAERGTTNKEQLQVPADLVRWARESGIVTDLTTATTEQLHHARKVRDAIFGLLAAIIDDNPSVEADRVLVNQVAARPGPVLQLDKGGKVHRTGGLDALLAALASDCLDLHTSSDRAALHWCADHRCTRPFIDRSRGHRRRWCGMKGCGDRAKAAAYYRRQRGLGSGSTSDPV